MFNSSSTIFLSGSRRYGRGCGVHIGGEPSGLSEAENGTDSGRDASTWNFDGEGWAIEVDGSGGEHPGTVLAKVGESVRLENRWAYGGDKPSKTISRR